jgi:uncharacterized membrane protein YfcA
MPDFLGLDVVWLVCGIVMLAAVAGFLAGLLGVGGGIILVPGLYFIFKSLGFPPEHLMHVAVGTSLSVIIPTGLAASVAHARKGAVRMDLVSRIGIGIVVGVGIGTLIADHVSGYTLKVIFALALIVFAGLMQLNPEKIRWRDDVPAQPWSGMAGVFIGTISTLMGIGGATLNVPYMSLHGVAIREAIGSASAMGVLIASPGAAGFLMIGWGESAVPPMTIGFINLMALAAIVPISVAIAPVGVSMAHRVSVKTLRRIFSIFMIVVAAKMLHAAIEN